MALSAQVAVPMVPVPITLQTLALPLIVLVLGRDLGALAMIAYLAEGAAGLPVFASGSGSAAILVGPTAGYLWSYPVAAYALGTLLERGLDRNYATRWFAIFVTSLLILGAGVWWLEAFANITFQRALALGALPFVIGDLLKVTIAAGLSSQSRALFERLGISI